MAGDRTTILVAGVLVAAFVLWFSAAPQQQTLRPESIGNEGVQLEVAKQLKELKELVAVVVKNQDASHSRLESVISDTLQNNIPKFKEPTPQAPAGKVVARLPPNTVVPNMISVPLPIEPLGPENAFRHPNWKQVGAENRDYLIFLPRLLNVDNILKSKPGRKIYLDLGLSTYASSIQWMFDFYPLKFDEIYGWEAVEGKFQLAGDFNQRFTGKSKFFTGKFIGVKDTADTMNLLKFLDELKYGDDDFVVMKMDVEGAEWDLLPALHDGGYFDKIDEFMVEIHYNEPQLYDYGWNIFTQSKQQVIDWMETLRAEGLYAHYWP